MILSNTGFIQEHHIKPVKDSLSGLNLLSDLTFYLLFFSAKLFFKYVAKIMVDMYFHLKSEGLSRRSVSLKKAKIMDIWDSQLDPEAPHATQSWEERKSTLESLVLAKM